MAWYPAAVKKPLTTRAFRLMTETPKRINFHTAVSNSSSLFNYWQTNTRGVYSHFYIRQDGTVEQYVDTKYRAVCDLDGNKDTISVETWDGYKTGYPGYWLNDSDVPPWTPAQLKAASELAEWVLKTHPSIPKKLATSNRAAGTESHGISYHRIGVPGYAKYTRDQGGLLYSLSSGKVCPGTRRVALVDDILRTATSIAPLPVKPAPSLPSTGVAWDGKSFPGTSAFVLGKSHPAVTLLGQRLLAHGIVGFYKEGPGPTFGPADVAATKAFQLKHSALSGDADGIPGPLTWTMLMAAPAKPKLVVDLSSLQQAARMDPSKPDTSTTSWSNVITVERALVKEGLLESSYVDGHFGTATVLAYRKWQLKCGAVGQGADGIPGMETLKKLGAKYGFEVVA